MFMRAESPKWGIVLLFIRLHRLRTRRHHRRRLKKREKPSSYESSFGRAGAV